MHLTKKQIESLPRLRRLNLVNALSGIKPGNLVGTVSQSGATNLAIFNSVVHLGSNPALLGMIVRPVGEVPRHTYENILATGFYTLNHIHAGIAKNAHFTSAKFAAGVSEFAACGLTEAWRTGFPAPFVAESHLRIGLQYLQSVPIEINGTILVIGQIEHVFLPDEALQEDGHTDLSKAGSIGISGLNSYYSLEKIAQYPYARPEELPVFGPVVE